MQSIAEHVYIEDSYPGVTLGAISLPHGLIQIDAPPSAEDSRTWRAALLGLGAGPDRVLVNLDAHPDRTLGARAMDCTVIAHERIAQVFRSRPATFKSQNEETGAEWEQLPALGNVRWGPPEITFNQQMSIHWDSDMPVLLEHHPGPTAGAIWVVLPSEKIVFVGDLVLKNQPPFLAHANLPAWIEALQLLMSAEYRSYSVISGRGGPVATQVVKAQLDFIKQVQTKLEKLAKRQVPADATENLVDSLMGSFKAPAARQKHYAQRLRYGLQHYYARNFHPTSGESDE